MKQGSITDGIRFFYQGVAKIEIAEKSLSLEACFFKIFIKK
jgi:hypothetical protein